MSWDVITKNGLLTRPPTQDDLETLDLDDDDIEFLGQWWASPQFKLDPKPPEKSPPKKRER